MVNSDIFIQSEYVYTKLNVVTEIFLITPKIKILITAGKYKAA